MKIHLTLRNESPCKGVGIYRRDALMHLAERVCQGEGHGGDAELSLLFCSDRFIQELNKTYRKQNKATDVLSFSQPKGIFHGVPVLGDIVISLETVERRCEGSRRAMRNEVNLLFCHGLLHLLGLDHDTPAARKIMNDKQALYLFLDPSAAWH